MTEEVDTIRKNQIIHASWVGIVGNAILSVLKISLGLISGSLAVVGDGIDSATDIVTSLITLLTARFISRPPDVKYPYGYEKAETIATKVLAFVIFFAGAQLGISTIQKIIANKSIKIPALLAIYVTVVSIIGKLALAYHQSHVGKKTKSSMLIANAKNMQNDVLVSSAVLAGLLFTFVLKMPILDTIVALLVSVWIMKIAFGIFIETTTDLMDGLNNPEMYDTIFKIIDSVPGAFNPHRMRLRKMGNTFMLELDIEVDGNLTVYQSHHIAHQVEEKICQTITDIYDVVIHVEPSGSRRDHEKFGISRVNIQ